MEEVTKKIFVTAQKVRELLTEHPHMRDSDDKLVSNYWVLELKALDINVDDISGKEMLSLFVNKRLTKPDIITRAKRKAQQKNPHLRGETWDERHGIADNVKDEIVRI